MARIKGHEKTFFENLRSDKPIEEVKAELPKEYKPDLTALRQARSIVKSIKDPHKAIAKILVNAGVNNTAFAKEGGIGAIGVYALLNRKWDTAWWNWEPETIWTMLHEEEGIEATEEIRNLVGAIQVVTKTNQPFENWHIFEACGQAFNMNYVSFGEYQPLEPDEVALTIHILSTIRPGQVYLDEVHGYVAACARHAGLIYLPEDLFSAKAQEILLTISPGGHDIYRKIKDALLMKEGILPKDPEVIVHLAKLREIRSYVKENSEA